MARKATPTGPTPNINLGPAELKRALQRLESTIEKLRQFPVAEISGEFDPRIEALEAEVDRRITDAFGHGTLGHNRYSAATHLTPAVMGFGGPTPIDEARAGLTRRIDSSVLLLEQTADELRERIGDAEPEPNTHAPGPIQKESDVSSAVKVFLVHGHSNDMTQTCARLIERLGAEVIILSEQPSGGMTIIEKLEAHGDVGYAVILMTPDDVGKASDDVEDPKPRARQNVVLELGYFIGRLGRNRVTALYDPSVEMPSDYHGVVYVPIDKEENWKLRIGRELRGAGLEIDLNKL